MDRRRLLRATQELVPVKFSTRVPVVPATSSVIPHGHVVHPSNRNPATPDFSTTRRFGKLAKSKTQTSTLLLRRHNQAKQRKRWNHGCATMEELQIAKARLETAHRGIGDAIEKLNLKENDLQTRLEDLKSKRFDPAQADLDVEDDDIVEVNAGGEIISARRAMLTQLKGTMLAALFSGGWDKKLQRDSSGRIFLDVNPIGFRAIVDYLNERAISSEDSPPSLPSVADEHRNILLHQLRLFRVDLATECILDKSVIINTAEQASCLREWLNQDGSDIRFNLIYSSSESGLSNQNFHSSCDGKGHTLTVIETTDGNIFGGYSNTPWASDGGFHASNKAFLFILSGFGQLSPCRMKLKKAEDPTAVSNGSSYGPAFGRFDLTVNDSVASLNPGDTYEANPSGHLIAQGELTVKNMEVFEITQVSSDPNATTEVSAPSKHEAMEADAGSDIFKGMQKAIAEGENSLQKAEEEVSLLETSFEDEGKFIGTFASGDAKDVITLNVSGTVMATKRSTMQVINDSVLAQQFDDSKWTEQGYNAPRPKEWGPEDVAAWVRGIDGVSCDIADIFVKNNVMGKELLAFDKEGLMMLGVTRAGTLCLLMKEIKKLERASQDIVTFIEHSPHCFGKVLDYLRMKQLQSVGLCEEPELPRVCDSQKSRLEKLIAYYFPSGLK